MTSAGIPLLGTKILCFTGIIVERPKKTQEQIGLYLNGVHKIDPQGLGGNFSRKGPKTNN